MRLIALIIAFSLGGIAYGIDRLVMLLAGETSIRDVIAFPKTTTAQCLLTGAPADAETDQLAELGIRGEISPSSTGE